MLPLFKQQVQHLVKIGVCDYNASHARSACTCAVLDSTLAGVVKYFLQITVDSKFDGYVAARPCLTTPYRHGIADCTKIVTSAS